jgi:HK97 family phage prohead protease
MSDLIRTSSLLRADGEGRTVHGVAVPFGEVATVNDGFGEYQERFEFGAFKRTIQNRGHKVRLFAVHSAARKLPIGKATELVEHPDGLHAAFMIAETRDGDDALELVRSGIVDSFSISFRPMRDRKDKAITVRTEVALIEVSLVGVPAYIGAAVAGVRSASSSPVSVDVARRRLDLLLKSW